VFGRQYAICIDNANASSSKCRS